MKLVLSAWIGSANLGDEAIAEVLIDWLERVPDVEQLTVLSINPGKTKRMAHKPSTKIVQAGLKNYWRELRSSDALLLGGGGIIQDQSSIINLLFYYLESWVAKHLLRKPVFWIFVGVTIKTGFGRWLLRRMSKLTTHVLVRDKASADLLCANKFSDRQITTAYDVVFNFPVPKPAKPKYTEDYILFCPRDWFFLRTIMPTRFALKRARRDPKSQLHTYRKQMVALIETVLRENPGVQVVGVPFFYTQDLNLLSYIKQHLSSDVADRYVIESTELLPAEFLQLARPAKAVLGVRLHSLILGATVDTPLIPIVYSAKVQSLTQYLGIDAVTTMLNRPDFNVADTAAKAASVLGGEVHTPQKGMLSDIRSRNQTAFSELLASIRGATGD